MFKHAIIYVLGLVVVVLAGLSLSNADEIAYSNVLNHAGITDQAFVYHTKRTKTVADVVKTFEADTTRDDYQVQFALGKNKTIFYAKGEYTKLPLRSGHFFTSADFTSSLPVAVVGTNLKSKLYKAGDQEYLKLSGKYIPVVGTVGAASATRLNNHVFLNASTTRQSINPKLNTVEIFVDGVNQSDLGLFTKAFGASPHKVSVAQTQNHETWWELYGGWMAAVVFTALGMAIIGLLTALMTPMTALDALDAPQQNRYIWRLGTRYLPGMAIVTVVGTAFSWWQFYLTDHFRLVVVSAVLYGCYILATQLFMHLRLNRKETR